jgi:hypothetical protein
MIYNRIVERQNYLRNTRRIQQKDIKFIPHTRSGAKSSRKIVWHSYLKIGKDDGKIVL